MDSINDNPLGFENDYVILERPKLPTRPKQSVDELMEVEFEDGELNDGDDDEFVLPPPPSAPSKQFKVNNIWANDPIDDSLNDACNVLEKSEIDPVDYVNFDRGPESYRIPRAKLENYIKDRPGFQIAKKPNKRLQRHMQNKAAGPSNAINPNPSNSVDKKKKKKKKKKRKKSKKGSVTAISHSLISANKTSEINIPAEGAGSKDLDENVH